MVKNTGLEADMGNAPLRVTLVIVGGGFSGTLAAVHWLSRAPDHTSVILIEPRERVGRGLAYSVWDDAMLLNVPAGNMSAFPDAPHHFLDYLQTLDAGFQESSFVPRRLYGDYLEHVLETHRQASRVGFRRIRAQAVDVISAPAAASGVFSRSDPAFRVVLDDGSVVVGDRVILASGYTGGQDMPFAAAVRSHPCYVADPWGYAAMDHLPTQGPIAILGTGHTAVDALFRVTSLHGLRTVYLISRHGLLPMAHRLPGPKGAAVAQQTQAVLAPHAVPANNAHAPLSDASALRSPYLAALPVYLSSLRPTVRIYMRAVRVHVKEREAVGVDWRDVLNELRPHLPVIWQALPVFERKRFLRTVRPWWDIHRHRLAPVAARRLEGAVQAGSVQVMAARVAQMEPVESYEPSDSVQHGLRLYFKAGPTGVVPAPLDVAAVINCAGPEYVLDRAGGACGALLGQLHRKGMIRGDSLGLGLHVDARYRLLNADGLPTPGFYYVGPMLRADYWEAIAVPELRVHVQRLVEEVLENTVSCEPA